MCRPQGLELFGSRDVEKVCECSCLVLTSEPPPFLNFRGLLPSKPFFSSLFPLKTFGGSLPKLETFWSAFKPAYPPNPLAGLSKLFAWGHKVDVSCHRWASVHYIQYPFSKACSWLQCDYFNYTLTRVKHDRSKLL